MLAGVLVLLLQASPIVGPPSPAEYAERLRPTGRRAAGALWVDTAWIVGGQGMDAGTTIYGLEHVGMVESNALVGSHPSTGTVLVTKAALALVTIAVCREMRNHGHPRMARVLAIGMGVLGAGAGTVNVALIYRSTHDGSRPVRFIN